MLVKGAIIVSREQLSQFSLSWIFSQFQSSAGFDSCRAEFIFENEYTSAFSIIPKQLYMEHVVEIKPCARQGRVYAGRSMILPTARCHKVPRYQQQLYERDLSGINRFSFKRVKWCRVIVEAYVQKHWYPKALGEQHVILLWPSAIRLYDICRRSVYKVWSRNPHIPRPAF